MDGCHSGTRINTNSYHVGTVLQEGNQDQVMNQGQTLLLTHSSQSRNHDFSDTRIGTYMCHLKGVDVLTISFIHQPNLLKILQHASRLATLAFLCPAGLYNLSCTHSAFMPEHAWTAEDSSPNASVLDTWLYGVKLLATGSSGYDGTENMHSALESR